MVHCPRCNGVASMRTRKSGEKSDFLSVILDCPQCKLKKTVGFTTEQAVDLYMRAEKLAEIAARTEDPAKLEGLMGAMARLRALAAERELKG